MSLETEGDGSGRPPSPTTENRAVAGNDLKHFFQKLCLISVAPLIIHTYFR